MIHIYNITKYKKFQHIINAKFLMYTYVYKTAGDSAECPIYQTHFDFGLSMGLVLVFKMSLTAGAGWLFNQVSAVILG